ncbi:MAG: hypothetical protein RAO94_08865 [Candidatus Stygibacter australis]|nr:hypothetical protein [Candidatus Stygibacter australis]
MDLSKGMKGTAIAIAMKFCAGLIKGKITEYANKYLSSYGRLIDYQLDFENKRVIVTIELKGEKEHFNIVLSDLKVFEIAGEYYLEIGTFDIEREWIKLLGQDYLDGKFGDPRINLSEKVGKTLSIVLK